MIDMVKNVCNKKILLLREESTREAKVTRKYPPGSSRMKMVRYESEWSIQTKKVRACGRQRSRAKTNGLLMRQKQSPRGMKGLQAERMVRARSASDHKRSTRGQ